MYNTNLVVGSGMAGLFRCNECHMNFQSQPLLTKHKSKFCVGKFGDPDDLQLRRGFRTVSPPRYSSPDDRPYTDSLLVNKKYERLRDLENSVAKQPVRMVSSRAGRLSPYSRGSDSSMSIHIVDDDYRRPNQDQLRSLAENHGRNMEYLQLRNKDLEKQREDILKKLEGLGRRSVVPQQDNTADLLRELREQEIRNQRALDDLKRQLYNMNTNQKVNVIEVEKPVYPMQIPPPAPAPAPPPPPQQKKQLVFPVYYGKSLVAEISAIRQAYLQNGGNDPDVLAQMAQMLAEAQALEDQMNQKPDKKSPREKPTNNNEMIKFMEMENERLNQELRFLHEQKLLAQNRGKSDKEGNFRPRYILPNHVKLRTDKVLMPLIAVENSYNMAEIGKTRRPKQDVASYHSEPGRHRKVIKYKAVHQMNGSVFVKRSNTGSYPIIVPYVPPLDLRGITTPSDRVANKRKKERENAEKRAKQQLSMPKEPREQFKNRPPSVQYQEQMKYQQMNTTQEPLNVTNPVIEVNNSQEPLKDNSGWKPESRQESVHSDGDFNPDDDDDIHNLINSPSGNPTWQVNRS